MQLARLTAPLQQPCTHSDLPSCQPIQRCHVQCFAPSKPTTLLMLTSGAVSSVGFPGGAWVAALQRDYAWLPPKLIARYARAYGTRTHQLLEGRHNVADMGEQLAEGLFAAELEYLVKNEWASSGADILWRRSKLGLHLPADTAQKIDQWIARTQ